ncbi:PAS domain-containing sensor histidine kinase [Maridesulfovibrio hydrothermalis]|uniref:Histidine kinase n=1 Tax=Maridesulfovibrio hydrothermalis AM13 = DSM 14728 TaxID=1121451 RepID=L0RB84_9BACT|nr:PAS domain-containing sensor histidine kinase [Maridesulfovibrio hydrothermalis]CCO23477.1 Histidine kinase [Maridesulfovibrio hydrothermalis AM13 = DSM 14728]
MNDKSLTEKTYPENCQCPPKVAAQHKQLKERFGTALIDSVPNLSFITNKNREVVFFNKALVETIGYDNENCIFGQRPGELLHCCNTQNNQCGESSLCNQCGASLAIETAITGQVGDEECMLLSNVDGLIKSYTFKVTAAPLVIDDEPYCIVHLTDISDRKNKEIVEKLFLHDLLNAVNGIVNAGTLLKEEAARESTQELADMIVDRAFFMTNEINAHRLFVSAENKQLEVHYEPVSIPKIFESISKFFSGNPLAKDKNITLTQNIENFEITTDKRILYRILENLIKNALEASPIGGTVGIKAMQKKDTATFTITNQGGIPLTVAHQIFKRSFSTKGKGRGLGTYSVKMFTENYLSGRVWFDSSNEDGTNFYVKLPVNPNENSFED